MRFHLAEVNVGRMKMPIDDPATADFVARLDEINQLADGSEGFVWRLKSEADSRYTLPYDDDRILFNLSVWESVEALKNYTYRTAHAELLRDKKKWFEQMRDMQIAMWWVPAGHVPGVDEAKKRLDYIREHGPSQYAFNFKHVFEPDPEYIRTFDWSVFLPCPAV